MPLEAADAGQGYDESLDFAGPPRSFDGFANLCCELSE